MSDDQVGGVQSVTRAVRALELIAEEGELGVTHLGRGLIRLVGAAMASIDLVRTAHPVLEELADRTHETVNIGVLSGGGVVYVDQVSSAHLVATTNWVGRRTPLHGSSSGKVFLAHMPEPERQRILERQLEEVRVRGYATI